MEYPIYLKYNLHKDNSPIWQGCKNEEEHKKYLKKLNEEGYNPRVDHAIKI